MIACVILIASITSTHLKSSPKSKNCKSETTSVITRYAYNFYSVGTRELYIGVYRCDFHHPFETPF